MKKVETKSTLICDLCGEEVNDFARAREDDGHIFIKVIYELFWAGDTTPDICYKCGKKLMRCIEEIKSTRKKG